jgi:Ala-tRNA(Pro) deacylase
MSLNRKLAELLDRHPVPFEILPHPEAFTAQEVAQRTHVPGRRLAKVVLLRDAAGAFLMVALPASEHVDLRAVRHASGREGLVLASEDELGRLFPDCESGAMPPIGHLYGVSMIVDACLMEDEIFFQAGNHHEVVRMRFEDFARIARPFVEGGCLHGAAVHVG